MKQAQVKSAKTVKATRAGKFVDTAHVDTLKSNYKSERWIQNSRKLGKEDSLSVWYSVEELEQFLAEAKSHGGDGVRMYFGAYSQVNAPNPLYAGRQTIVMVATSVKDTDGMVVNKDLYISTPTGSNIVAYNLGKMCPPFCGGHEGGIEEMEIRITDMAITI
ncbi:MAG: hypothetical protein EOO09_20820 [Chitinophagaceae bacterium]|nr:MAG: hypothetical protein EOO09_20820 [Chitinophagaceae bacterium]